MSTADNGLKVWDQTIRLQVAYRFVSFEWWCWGTLFDLSNDFIWTYVVICKAEWSPGIIATNDVKCHYLQISIENIRKLRKKIKINRSPSWLNHFESSDVLYKRIRDHWSLKVITTFHQSKTCGLTGLSLMVGLETQRYSLSSCWKQASISFWTDCSSRYNKKA